MQHRDGLPTPRDSSVFVESEEEELQEEGSKAGARTERIQQETRETQRSV